MSKRFYNIFLLFCVFLFLSFSASAYAYTEDEALTYLDDIHSSMQNLHPYYSQVFDSYIILYYIPQSSLQVYIYNSQNTKLFYYNNRLYFTYCFSEDNPNIRGYYVYRCVYDESKKSCDNWSTRYSISNLLENTTGFYGDCLNLSNDYHVLYTDTDILTATVSAPTTYTETLPFDIDDLEVYMQGASNQSDENNVDENQQEEPSQTISNEALEEYFENSLAELEHTNTLLKTISFLWSVWFIIDFLRHSFFNERR